MELLMTPSVFNSFLTPSKKCAEPVSNVIVPVDVISPPVKPFPAVSEVMPLPALGAYEADTAKLALVANDAVAGINVMEVAAEDVVANELDIELFAQLEVPINAPVNEPLNEPVLICVDDDTTPLGNVAADDNA